MGFFSLFACCVGYVGMIQLVTSSYLYNAGDIYLNDGTLISDRNRRVFELDSY